MLMFLLLFSVARYLSAQVMGFEDGIPAGFRCDGNGNLALTSLYYKEGTKCLEWNYKPGSALYIPLESPLELTSKVKQRYGITLWMYNEVPQQDSIRFEFLSSDNKIVYQFGFRLASSGWRACWIGFQHMAGSKEGKDIAGCRLVAPKRKGRVFLDRLLFPETETNDRTTPDMQMPYNNSFDFRDLWHWCRVWQWEQYEYDIPLSSALTLQEQTELKTIESRLTEMLCSSKGDMDKAVSDAYSVFQQVAIRPSGSGFVGAPLVAPDELNREKVRFRGMTWKPCCLALLMMRIIMVLLRLLSIIFWFGNMPLIRDLLMEAAWGLTIIMDIRFAIFIKQHG